MTVTMQIFTAIYSISSLQNLLFTCFSSPVGFFCVIFAVLCSKQPKVLVFAVHLAVGTFSEVCFSLFFEELCFCALG